MGCHTCQQQRQLEVVSGFTWRCLGYAHLQWADPHVKSTQNCEAVENDFSKRFNSVILSVGNKPLLTMLEAIRVIVLERMNTMRRVFWHVIPTGGQLFEVRNGSEAFGVDEKRRTCTCRLWKLSSFSCPHAITVILKLNRREEEYVPGYFRKQSFHYSYHQYLTPVGGMTFWLDCSDMSKVLPLKPKKCPVGLERKESGHNKTSCKNETIVLPPKPPCKKSRPRKTQVGVEEQLVEEEVVDEPYDAKVVDERSSQSEVGESSNGRSNIQKGTKRHKTKNKRGGLGIKVGSPSFRFSRIVKWFGLGQVPL
ncbi:pentatricopeptide repeat-containing protein [Tanacetum coccineum]